MENLNQNKTLVKEEKDNLLTGFKEEKDDFSTNVDIFPAKPSSSMTDENEYDVVVPSERDTQENNYRSTDSEKRVKLVENGISTYLKLKGFFEVVQKQHPESRLELQQVNGNWRVWCGVCRKLLRPDKSGKAIHNIQRQHFTSARHQKKLHLMLQAEKDVAENAKDGQTHDDEHGDVQD